MYSVLSYSKFHLMQDTTSELPLNASSQTLGQLRLGHPEAERFPPELHSHYRVHGRRG